MKIFSSLSILLIALLCSGIICKGQNPLVKQWDYRYGGNGFEHSKTLVQTFDRGFLLGGFSTSGVSGDKTQSSWGGNDYWIVKVDSLGNYQWDKRFGGSGGDYLFSVEQTSDRGYILGGESSSNVDGNKSQPNWDTSSYTFDYWIVKIDSLGNYQWDKRFGGTQDDLLYSIQQTSDRGYILGGSSKSGINGDKSEACWGGDDYWIVKTDSMGNYQWDKRFGGTEEDLLNKIEQTADGGFILGGNSSSGVSGNKTQPSWGNYDYWVVKTDSDGNYQWDKRFGGTDVDGFRTLEQTSDNGFILGGNSYSMVSGDKSEPSWGYDDYWIIKLDASGSKLWDKDFGGTSDEDDLGSITLTVDGGYLITGASGSQMSGDKTEDNLGGEQTWIVKTDASGNYQWDKTIFTTGHDEASYAAQTLGGCYVILNETDAGIGGYKTQPSWGATDYWIIKFCDTTIATSINSTLISNSNPSIFPNPFTTSTTITLTNYTAPFNLQLFDELGIEAPLKYHTTQQGNNIMLTLDRNKLLSGVYFLSITSKEKREVVKLMVE